MITYAIRTGEAAPFIDKLATYPFISEKLKQIFLPYFTKRIVSTPVNWKDGGYILFSNAEDATLQTKEDLFKTINTEYGDYKVFLPENKTPEMIESTPLSILSYPLEINGNIWNIPILGPVNRKLPGVFTLKNKKVELKPHKQFEKACALSDKYFSKVIEGNDSISFEEVELMELIYESMKLMYQFPSIEEFMEWELVTSENIPIFLAILIGTKPASEDLKKNVEQNES